MTLEDIIKKLKNPDTLNEGLTDLQDYDSARAAAIADNEKKLAESAETIATLRDTNQRLYLRVVSDQPEDVEEDDRSDFEKLIGVERKE